MSRGGNDPVLVHHFFRCSWFRFLLGRCVQYISETLRIPAEKSWFLCRGLLIHAHATPKKNKHQWLFIVVKIYVVVPHMSNLSPGGWEEGASSPEETGATSQGRDAVENVLVHETHPRCSLVLVGACIYL